MPDVYVTQQPPIDRDLQTVTAYGTVRVLLPRRAQPSADPDEYYPKVAEALQNFTKNDFVLYAGGDPLAYAMALLVLADMGFTRVNTLRWERNKARDGSGFYVPVDTIISQGA